MSCEPCEPYSSNGSQNGKRPWSIGCMVVYTEYLQHFDDFSLNRKINEQGISGVFITVVFLCDLNNVRAELKCLIRKYRPYKEPPMIYVYFLFSSFCFKVKSLSVEHYILSPNFRISHPESIFITFIPHKVLSDRHTIKK